MKPLQLASILLASSVLSACTTDFDPGSRVTHLRVLAVQADHAYARPGEEVKLEALAFDPVAGRKTTFAWATCVNPASSTVDACIAQLAMDARATGKPPVVTTGEDLRTFTFRVPDDVIGKMPPSGRPNAMVGVVTVACPGTLTFTDSSSSLPFVCNDASGRVLGTDEMVVGIKRVMVRATDRNANPQIARVTWDGADWPESEIKDVSGCDTTGNKWDDCKDGDKHTVAALAADGSGEEGVDEFATPFSEQVVNQYYATEGIFEHDTRIARDPGTFWVARKSASGQTLTMWLVLRDNRGGVSWATRKVHVR